MSHAYTTPFGYVPHGTYSGSYSGSDNSYMPPSPEDSPRSATASLTYGSGSDYSGSSHRSATRPKRGNSITISMNGKHVADIDASSVAATTNGPTSRRRRAPSIVLHTAERQPHRRGPSGGSHSSRSPIHTQEPEKIYIEENTGPGERERRLIIDNGGRRHRKTHSDQGDYPPRRDRSQSGNRGRVMSWSDEEDNGRSRSRSRSKSRPRSIMKRRPSIRRKSVAFDDEDTVIESLQSLEIDDRIRRENEAIASRPAVPGNMIRRPKVTTRTLDRDALEIDHEREENARNERLRQRQNHRPPISNHGPQKKRRNSIVVTAPPLGLYNPNLDPGFSHGGHSPHSPSYSPTFGTSPTYSHSATYRR